MGITSALLKRIIADQIEEHNLPGDYIPRTAESQLAKAFRSKEIIVLTGLRRSGKSVLLHHIRQQNTESDYYFNFEDERLSTFLVDDFQMLQETFIELFGLQKTYYFDEIQNIKGWEVFVRRLYNAGNKIYITGSNANLFSEELGTRLTGRYIAYTIYPLCFQEYIYYKNKKLLSENLLSTAKIGQIKKLFSDYCQEGGIPEYVKYKNSDYLRSLYEGILYRDIIARYKLPQSVLIKTLVFYLASNCSKEITYNSLRKLIGIKSATTISDYCYYLENSYLCFFVNRYSDSVKSQLQSPKKVYFIDTAVAKIVGFRISEDIGRTLENIVFLELKRRNYEIFYHQQSKECDFLVRENINVTQAIQVCQTLVDPKTKKREIEGLMEAMERFSLQTGLIITESETFTEEVQKDGKIFTILVVPAWDWLRMSFDAVFLAD
jgi:predicted AAA+ superfamily ATPase